MKNTTENSTDNGRHKKGRDETVLLMTLMRGSEIGMVVGLI